MTNLFAMFNKDQPLQAGKAFLRRTGMGSQGEEKNAKYLRIGKPVYGYVFSNKKKSTSFGSAKGNLGGALSAAMQVNDGAVFNGQSRKGPTGMLMVKKSGGIIHANAK